MKKIAFLFTFFLFSSATIPAIAQDNFDAGEPALKAKHPKKSPEEKAKLMTAMLNTAVSLSAEQFPKAYEANLKFVKAREAAKASAETGDIKSKIKEAAKARKAELTSILTPEQLTKWEAWKQAKKAEVKKGAEGKYPDDTDDLEGM